MLLLPKTARHVISSVLCCVLLGCGQQDAELTEPAASGSTARTRLLTAAQYVNTVTHVFGADISESVLPPVPPMHRTDGLLASGAALVGVTSDQLSQIQLAAARIARQVVDEEHRDFLLPCRPESVTTADPACAADFLSAAGRLLLRRPLSTSRLAQLVDTAGQAVSEATDFYGGLALALEALLISPEFVFIAETTEPDPARPGRQRLDAYSLASRLSFFLWNAPPDDGLLTAAQSGALHSRAGLESAVDRLLASDYLRDGMRRFFDDMLALDEFDSLAKDPLVYPSVTGTTLADAREQTLRTVLEHLLVAQADYRDLFTTRKTFLSMPLAAVYGVPGGAGWMPFEFGPDSPRIGLLTHLSFLAANAHPVRSSPTLRGKALREHLLCQKVPDPPPNVDFSALDEAEHATTARQRLAAHNSNPSCAGCHLITDPPGLSLENFDGAGIYRATGGGVPLDISGELDGIFYEDIQGLAMAVRNHPKLSACLVRRLYAYATGGPVSLRHDRDTLKWLETRFMAAEYRLRPLLRELALSQAFASLRPAPEAQM